MTASFMDYAMPRADGVPFFHFETRNVPSTTNALGIKGAGEAGTIGAAPAAHERGGRRALPRLRHPPDRHAGDARPGLAGDRGGAGLSCAGCRPCASRCGRERLGSADHRFVFSELAARPKSLFFALFRTENRFFHFSWNCSKA